MGFNERRRLSYPGVEFLEACLVVLEARRLDADQPGGRSFRGITRRLNLTCQWIHVREQPRREQDGRHELALSRMGLSLSQELGENAMTAQKHGDGEVEDVVRHGCSSARESEGKTVLGSSDPLLVARAPASDAGA